MPQHKKFTGVIAALLLPRDDEDQPAWQDFDRNARFVLDAGVTAFCVNGATGEFAGATHEERREVIVRARRAAGASGAVLSGIGATRWREILALAREAVDAGADGLLAPPPHFFPYEQTDLAEYYQRLTAELAVPILIYNLPAFTTGVDPSLAAHLVRTVPGIAGVKDSSGRLGLLEDLAANGRGDAVALVGNDSVLAEALRRNLCDGCISGVAGVLPELTLALWQSGQARDGGNLARAAAALDSLLAKLEAFPTPWALKLIAELRGLAPAALSLPLSAERRAQVDDFRCWFPAWWESAKAA